VQPAELTPSDWFGRESKIEMEPRQRDGQLLGFQRRQGRNHHSGMFK